MSNESQVAIVKRALEKEKEVKLLDDRLLYYMGSSFRRGPVEPIPSKVVRTYPEVKSTFKCWPFFLGLLIVPGGPIIFIILYFTVFKKKKAADIENIKNSPEYLAKIKALDKDYDAQDEILNTKYLAAKKEYDEELLPKYKAEKAKWEEEKLANVNETRDQLTAAENELKEIYNTSKLIPSQYHNIASLQYLYDLMSSSEYDIKEAIDKFDRDEDRRRDAQHKYEMERAAYAQAEAQWQAAESAERMRKDQNTANATAVAQRHETNKKLDKILKQ